MCLDKFLKTSIARRRAPFAAVWLRCDVKVRYIAHQALAQASYWPNKNTQIPYIASCYLGAQVGDKTQVLVRSV